MGIGVHGGSRQRQNGQQGGRWAMQGGGLAAPPREENKEHESKGRCSFSIHYLYETTTSLYFPPTTNIAEGGARGVRVPCCAVGLRPVVEPRGRYETRDEWSVRREWKLSTGSQAGSLAGGRLLTMTALSLINTRFLIPVCFSLLCNLLYQTGMGVSPNGT